MRSIFIYLYSSKRFSMFLFVLWTLFILYACFMPPSDVPKVKIPYLDKVVHFILFANFSFLGLCMSRQYSRYSKLLFWLLATFLGALIEIIQASNWVKGRSFEWEDILADSFGGLIGILMFSLFYSLSKSKIHFNRL